MTNSKTGKDEAIRILYSYNDDVGGAACFLQRRQTDAGWVADVQCVLSANAEWQRGDAWHF